MKLFDTYKECRDKDDGFLGGPSLSLHIPLEKEKKLQKIAYSYKQELKQY